MRLIDADDLLTAFPLYDDEPTYTKSCIRMTINHMPTIEAEPIKHGRWIDHTYKYRYPVGRYECSICGAAHDMEWGYCPTCGAKMDGERREDETD